MRRMYSKPQLLEAVEQEAEVNGLKAFENIVDKDGHARFIEGDITIEDITGISQSYGKWALSGTHLLIVLALTAEDTTAISANTTIADLSDLPSWILDKIVASTGITNRVDTKSIVWFNSDGTNQTCDARLNKSGVSFYIALSAITFTKQRSCRIVFDLLIDNE